MEHLQRQPRAITTDTEFRGRDLRGVSFCDRDLAGADFSDADLRGADFSGTNLARATFTNAHLGVRPRTGALILAAALLISIAAGALIGFYADLIRDTAGSEDWRDRLGAWLLVAVVVLFLALLIVRGARTATLVTAIVLALVAVGDIALVYTVAGEIRYPSPRGSSAFSCWPRWLRSPESWAESSAEPSAHGPSAWWQSSAASPPGAPTADSRPSS